MSTLSALDLNLLLLLDTVLAERSVAGAARRLHVTPSAVSNALARLRGALGDPLLARRGRGIVPTPRALELAPVLARALGDLEEALSGQPFDPATATRTFTLALADVGQVVLLPRVARRLSTEMPRARLRVVGIESLVSLGDLGGTEIDAAIGVKGDGPGLHAEPLFEERLVLACRAGHALATARRPAPEALARVRHVAVDLAPGRGFPDPVAKAWTRAGAGREVAVTVPSFTAAAAVVAATDLVATLPSSLLEVLRPRLGLRALTGPVPDQTIPMHLSWHDRTDADPALAAFRSVVRRALSEPAAGPRRSLAARART